MKRLRRALLFSPGDSLRKIEKGAQLAVDGLIMDLEDGVAPEQKAAARQTVAQALTTLDFGSSERLVRLNPMQSSLAREDFLGTVEARPDAYVLPKVESAQHVIELSDWLTHIEQRRGWPLRGIRILAIVESALGIVNLLDIVQSSRRLDAIIFGAQDFASSISALRTAADHPVNFARSQVVIFAKAMGLQAIDTPFLTIKDTAGLAQETRAIMEMGFDGKLAIHPSQVSVIEQAFAPTAEELRYAQALLAAYEQHLEQGEGVFVFEGKMVDMPNILSARQVLARGNT